MNWTERQLEAIEKRKSTLLVSAAAGSGKTAVLVERIKRLLLEDETDIDRMLVVTFTNAAAAEMREKISKMLNKALSEPGQDSERRKFLRRQTELLGRANISTFDSFALDILRKYYHIIGIDPKLRICDESRQSIFMRDAMDEMFEERFDARDPELIYFLDRYAGSKNNDPAKNMIFAVHRFIQSLPDPDAWLKEASSGALFDSDRFMSFAAELAAEELSAVCSYLKMASEVLLSAGEGKLPKVTEKHNTDVLAAEAVRSAFASSPEEGFKALSEGISWQKMAAYGAEKEPFAGVSEACRALRDKAKQRFKALRENIGGLSEESLEKEKELMLPSLAAVCSLTADFSARYGAKKRASRCLDFSDAEHMALKILENEEVCAECRERFDYIFIDEYQDSNLVQESLIQRICRPDNVFMVGDVKQSIYKFRLAEPELFLGKYKDIKGGRLPGSEVVDLNSNFRSKGPVINYVNKIFEAIMTEASCGITYDDDAKLIEGAPYTGSCLYEPELYLVGKTASEDDEPADEEIAELKKDELEALNAVRIIKSWLGKPIFDSAAQKTRPLGYGDMAILLRAVKGRGEIYYKTLLDAGIPVLLDRSEGYFDVIEIQVFMNLLRLIDNSQKDIPLLSVLRFPAFGFKADDLAAVRVWADRAFPPGKEKRRLEYNQAFEAFAENGPEGELKQRCSSFLDMLSEWRLKASYMPLGDFLWELLNETFIIDFCAALPSGKQRRANLNALISKAESYESDNASGLYGFINYIDTISGQSLKLNMGQARISLGGTDAVRIMTIHKSKGLEFPFVLTAGLGNGLFSNNSSESPNILLDKQYGAAMRIVDPDRDLYYDPASLGLIKRRKKREELAELIRVLYVALTRAKDILVLSGYAENVQKKLDAAALSVSGDVSGCSTYLDMLLPVVGRGKTKIVLAQQLVSAPFDDAPRELELRKAFEKGFDTEGSVLPAEEIEKRLAWKYFDGSSEKQKRKYSVSQLAEIERRGLEDLPRVLCEDENAEEKEEAAEAVRKRRVPSFISSETKLNSAQRGTAYHSVMEHIPFTPENKTPKDIVAFIEDLAERNILERAEAAAVDPAKISAFFSSDIGKRALAAPEVVKEAPFVLKHEYLGREILVQGTIDCYFEEDGEIVLLDYKSNYVNIAEIDAELEELRRSYIPQLSLYREALEKIKGKKVKEAALYLFATGGTLLLD